VLNARRFTNMADTDIDAIKQKKAEYDKQHRLTRKLLLQQQACTPSESDLAEKNKILTRDMHMYRLRHIHDPVLSSLKMEGIRLLFFLLSIIFYTHKFSFPCFKIYL
jgi:hypothetical protein